jgi:hypothetical protein
MQPSVKAGHPSCTRGQSVWLLCDHRRPHPPQQPPCRAPRLNHPPDQPLEPCWHVAPNSRRCAPHAHAFWRPRSAPVRLHRRMLGLRTL